jgi:transcriptional regulator with XRE-family HTH domain
MFQSKRLKQARFDADMTQAELAKKAGMNRHHISHLECANGRNSPSLENLISLCKALGISADYLLAIPPYHVQLKTDTCAIKNR